MKVKVDIKLYSNEVSWMALTYVNKAFSGLTLKNCYGHSLDSDVPRLMTIITIITQINTYLIVKQNVEW